MAGKFEIYKDKAGEFRFRLKASNGQSILASEGYKAISGCTNGIESVKKNAPDDARYDRKTTESGKYRFNLTGIATSATPDNERNYGMEDGGKRSRNILAVAPRI